jgi:uncharacterized protein with FMN-binding domain
VSSDLEPSSERHNQQGTQRPAPPAVKPRRKQGVSKKLSNGLVALSSAAVIAVYAAGYVRTAPAAASVASASSPAAIVSTVGTPATTVASLLAPTATATTAAVTATSAAATTAAAPVTSAVPTATATATSAATTQSAQVAASSAYRDGTYTGSGTSRHGGVTVAVVIKNGKIVSAEITASNTRYPISRIASLPGEVVAAQSANIDFVSGATDSSMAFQTAVASALARAK